MYMLSCGRDAISAYVRESSFNCGGSTRLDFKPVVHFRDWLSKPFYLFNSQRIYSSLSLFNFLFKWGSFYLRAISQCVMHFFNFFLKLKLILLPCPPRGKHSNQQVSKAQEVGKLVDNSSEYTLVHKVGGAQLVLFVNNNLDNQDNNVVRLLANNVVRLLANKVAINNSAEVVLQL